jgi:hypothetical protein
MNVFHDMDLALVLRKRKASRSICQSPLPPVIVDRKAYIFDQRRPRTTFGFVFLIRPRRSPDSGQIDLAKCRDSYPKRERKEEEPNPKAWPGEWEIPEHENAL